jgi:sigma-70-like protein
MPGRRPGGAGDRAFPAGWHAGSAGAGEMLAGELSGASPPGSRGSESPRDALRGAVSELSIPHHLSYRARLRSADFGTAVVFRAWPARSLHVAGASALAAELRRLIAAGAEPGWELHPVPEGRTPLRALAVPLLRLSGSNRFFSLLDRSGFACVEEVAAVPDECLLDLRNGGPRFVAAVRQVLSELGPGIAAAEPAAPDGQDRVQPLPALAPGTLRAVQVAVAWAVAEQGARTAGDLVPLVGRMRQLPPDVAAAWDHIRRLDLRQIAGQLLPDASLVVLAGELLGEVDQRRQLILTARTFAPPPRRTYASLAAELGITRERIRQLEADALGKLALVAADDRYAPLRWRAASAAEPRADTFRPVEDAPAWMEGLLRWLQENTRSPRPAGSA